MLVVPTTTAGAADLVSLSPQTWDRYVPDGKEVDAIHGDFALANDQLVAVVAHPRRGRNANMTVREVGGCLIDLTRRDRPSDQLSAFYPGAQLRTLRFAGIDVEAPTVYEAAELDRVFVKARRVTLRLVATPLEQTPDVEVAYTLQDGWPYVLVTTTFTNRGDKAVDADLLDSVRADRSFERCPEGPLDLFWVYDRHFGQAYGVQSEGHRVLSANARAILLRYQDEEGKVAVRLEPGEAYKLVRRVIPGDDTFQVRSIADRLSDRPARPATVTVRSEGRPVAGADVRLDRDGALVAAGRTDADGILDIDVGEGPARLTVSEPSRGSLAREIGAGDPDGLTFDLPEPGVVAAHVTDGRGGPIPCKVQFIGRDGTPDPRLRARQRRARGQEPLLQPRRLVPPGAGAGLLRRDRQPRPRVRRRLHDDRRGDAGRETRLEATLTRSVKTDGWISSDFHSHSSPSGDNTASQLGRVLNLLCEHIEFAPCTEHNRISTYEPHLERLGAERLMATCTGIELTGRPLPINHQNAFPLVMRPGAQDGGAPTTDDDPEVQIERLALWDGASEKLVQVNHPDIGWMFFDRDGDGVPDSGFAGMAGHMDVIEVHPPAPIFERPDTRVRRQGLEQHDPQLAAAAQPGPADPGRGQHRRPLQLPRLGLAAELPQEPDRRPRRDQDARRGPRRRAGPARDDQRPVPGGHAPRRPGRPGGRGGPGRGPGRPRRRGDAARPGAVPELVRRRPRAGLRQRPARRVAQFHAQAIDQTDSPTPS